jgi:hypothetical protein
MEKIRCFYPYQQERYFERTDWSSVSAVLASRGILGRAATHWYGVWTLLHVFFTFEPRLSLRSRTITGSR